jgi:hypothetical protein
MKTKISLAITIALISMCINAQDSTAWKLNSVSISTGETPLLNGLAFSGVITKGKSTWIADYTSTLGEVIYLYAPKKWIFFGPSVGFLKNTTWVGPIASLNLFKGYLTTLNWVGWSFGDPEIGNTSGEIGFMFSYHQTNINWKSLQVYHVLLHYQKNPTENIFGIKETYELSDNISLFGGWGYMLDAEKHLWSTGLNYNF